TATRTARSSAAPTSPKAKPRLSSRAAAKDFTSSRASRKTTGRRFPQRSSARHDPRDSMQYDVRYGAAGSHRYAGTFLFVVSHMRSYSSLLCHILGSHPAISGYSEAHQSYFGRNDLDRLARTVREHTEEAALKPYVLDKVLHDNTEIAP